MSWHYTQVVYCHQPLHGSAGLHPEPSATDEASEEDSLWPDAEDIARANETFLASRAAAAEGKALPRRTAAEADAAMAALLVRTLTCVHCETQHR